MCVLASTVDDSPILILNELKNFPRQLPKSSYGLGGCPFKNLLQTIGCTQSRFLRRTFLILRIRTHMHAFSLHSILYRKKQVASTSNCLVAVGTPSLCHHQQMIHQRNSLIDRKKIMYILLLTKITRRFFTICTNVRHSRRTGISCIFSSFSQPTSLRSTGLYHSIFSAF